MKIKKNDNKTNKWLGQKLPVCLFQMPDALLSWQIYRGSGAAAGSETMKRETGQRASTWTPQEEAARAQRTVWGENFPQRRSPNLCWCHTLPPPVTDSPGQVQVLCVILLAFSQKRRDKIYLIFKIYEHMCGNILIYYNEGGFFTFKECIMALIERASTSRKLKVRYWTNMLLFSVKGAGIFIKWIL